MRIINNGKTEGGMGLASLAVFGDVIESGALKVGSIYFIKSKAEDVSVLPEGIKAGFPFLCSKTATLVDASGDAVYEVTQKPLGFARDKNIDYSKNVVDTTTDCDYPNTSSITEGSVTKTGSVSGYMMIDKKDSALNKFLAQFENIVYATAGEEGEADTYDIQTPSSPVSMLVIDWTALAYGENGPSEGDGIHIDFVPVILNQAAVSGSKGSAVTLSFNYQGQPSDELGNKSAKYIGAYHKATV